jgi:adenosylhomocysteine nucleosidase
MPDVLAVDMEGAAVAQVCKDYNIPFIVIRTISDKADHSAIIDFREYP